MGMQQLRRRSSIVCNAAGCREDWSQQTFVLMKTSGRSLSSSSSRLLGQDQYIFISVIYLQDIFKTFSRHLQDVLQKYFRDIFKTSRRHLEDVLQKCFQDMSRTTSRRFEDVFKTSSRKTYHQVKLFLLTRRRDVFNTFLRHAAKTVIYRRIYLGHTPEIYGQCTEFARVIKISQVLVFHFTTPFTSCLGRRIWNLVEHLQWSFL